MKSTFVLFAIMSGSLFMITGCSSSTPEVTSEQKKAFMGGPMPKDFAAQHQPQMNQAQDAAQKAAAKAAQEHAGK